MAIKKIKVGVTGLGFIGSQVCRNLLYNGYDVIAIDNFYLDQCDHAMSLFNYPNFIFEECNILNFNKIQSIFSKCDAIIHTAGIVGAPKVDSNIEFSKAVNINGTKNIVEIANNRPLVNCSTGSIYGKITDICTEDCALNPTSNYGIHKKIAEDIVTNTNNTISLRFATGCGVGSKYRLTLLPNTLVYLAIKERSLNVFEADANRTFIHVQDMSTALIWAMERILYQKEYYKYYNCGDESCNWSKRELAEYIKLKTGCSVSYNDTQKDPDQRDYKVSYDRINNHGWKAQYNMSQIIDELIRACKLINITHQYQ